MVGRGSRTTGTRFRKTRGTTRRAPLSQCSFHIVLEDADLAGRYVTVILVNRHTIHLGDTATVAAKALSRIKYLGTRAFLFNHSNYFVQAGAGIVQTEYMPVGANCGDGATVTPPQTCFLVPNSGFKTLQSINQLNGPRTFQFAFRYQF